MEGCLIPVGAIVVADRTKEEVSFGDVELRSWRRRLLYIQAIAQRWFRSNMRFGVDTWSFRVEACRASIGGMSHDCLEVTSL